MVPFTVDYSPPLGRSYDQQLRSNGTLHVDPAVEFCFDTWVDDVSPVRDYLLQICPMRAGNPLTEQHGKDPEGNEFCFPVWNWTHVRKTKKKGGGWEN